MTQFTTGADKRHDGRTDTELSDRAVRALTEYMSVLDEGGDVYSVTTESGSEYRVDAREGRCTCPDAEYNLAAGEQCKHELRVAFATGERAVPAWADTDAVDDQLGIHVDGTPQVAATDGGVIDAGDEGEIVDAGGERIEGPFPEFNKYGNYTGEDYYRCGGCGTEAMREKDLSDCCEGAQ